MSEDHATRLKRLHMRSIRRGIKEMDLILGAYADTSLPGLTDGALDTYEAFLSENDQDLFSWVSGAAEPPAHYRDLVAELNAQSAVALRNIST